LAVFFIVIFVALAAVGNGNESEVANVAEGEEGAEGDVDEVGNESDEEEDEGGNQLDAMEAGHSPAAAPTAQRRFHSIAHEDITGGKMGYVHADLEFDKYAGILQIAVAFMDSELNITGEFNEYVRPPDNARWEDQSGVSGLTKTDPRITNAAPIDVVWPRFVRAVESFLMGDRVGMLLAWNGKASDCTKLFELTEIKRKDLNMPRGLVYFGDPMTAISGYKTNKYNNTKRGPGIPEGYGLAMVYRIIFGEELDDAHDALADAKAQAAIFAHPAVQETFDRCQCVMKMEDVWKGKAAQQARYEAEPTRAVPLGWVDKGEDTYQVPRERSYTGPAGGGEVGPSYPVRRACAHRDLGDLFLFYFPITILQWIAKETNRYGNEDWVRPGTEEEWRQQSTGQSGGQQQQQPTNQSGSRTRTSSRASSRASSVHFDMSAMEHRQPTTVSVPNDRVFIGRRPEEPAAATGDDEDDSSNESSNPEFSPEDFYDFGPVDDTSEMEDDESLDSTLYAPEPKRKQRLVPCDASHPKARKRYKNNSDPWVKVTVGYLLAWFGCLIIIGATKIRMERELRVRDSCGHEYHV